MDIPLLQILIIAATSRLRTSLQAVVASLPRVHRVYTAVNETTVTQTLATTSIDVVLLAGDLPCAGQRQLLRALQHTSPAVTIILFGGTEGARQQARQAGVTTLLPNDCPTELLTRQMNRAYRTKATRLAACPQTLPACHDDQPQAQTTCRCESPIAQATHTVQVVVRKESRMTESTNGALVTALRDFFMARDRTELRTAYLALAQAAPQPAPRGIAWDELEFAFNRLFVGPKALFAPPYASVYLEPEPQLMGRTTLKMREFYQLLTLASPARQQLPEDHLGLELDAYRQLQIAATQVNSAELFTLLDYLSNHLQQWVPLFVARVHRAEGTPPALLFVVDQLAQWLAAEEMTNKSRSLSNRFAMIGAGDLRDLAF